MNIDTSSLTPDGKRKLQELINQEQQKASIQGTVHTLSELCFKKCVFGISPGNRTLSSTEDSCMANCVNRFMDSNMAVLEHLDKLRSSQ